VAKKKAPLKVSAKSKVVDIPRVKGKSYPVTKMPMYASLEAVKRAADTLVGMGFDRVSALEILAAQLHENLLNLKAYLDKQGGK
jgi:hypothetical protein